MNVTGLILKLLLGVLVAWPVILLVTVAKNDLPLFEPPGPWARLKVYLGTNVAATRPDHPWPEMREIVLDGLAPGQARERVVAAIARLGWETVDAGPVDRIHAVVTTRWLRFRDDLEIALSAVAGGTRVDVRSASRVGRSDMGTNARHILDLLDELRARDDGTR